MFEAGLVGVVECETAGGILARYRVVESWKGPPQGALVTIVVQVNTWEPQFPIALCGERYLVAARRLRGPYVRFELDGRPGGGVPMWWRDLGGEYVTPLFQGWERIGSRNESTVRTFSYRGMLASFRDSVLSFFSLSMAQQEAAVLREHSVKVLERERVTSIDHSVLTEMSGRLGTLGVHGIIDSWRSFASRDWKAANSAQIALGFGGGPITLERLQALPPGALPDGRMPEGFAIRTIQERFGLSAPEVGRAGRPSPPPSRKGLAQYRLSLDTLGRATRDTRAAFEALCVYDPAHVATWLADQEFPEDHFSQTANGYVYGSYFAHRCRLDRVLHLRTLLKAKNAYVRVAGAVYLAMEMPSEGIRALGELQDLPGDPGAWAAIVLASRGDKKAVDRALKVLSSRGDPGMGGVPHRNWQRRLAVLLSNSAKRSGASLPPRWDGHSMEAEGAYVTLYESYVSWWKRNQRKVALLDPWLPTLERQRID